MIDHDDENALWFLAMFSDGPIGLIVLIVAMVFSYYACKNDEKCAQRSCPPGMTAKLMEHDCMCYTPAKVVKPNDGSW